jgi:hypothetical protein
MLRLDASHLQNYCPHPLTFYDSEKKELIGSIPAQSAAARCQEKLDEGQNSSQPCGHLVLENGREVPIYLAPVYGEVSPLPESGPIAVSMLCGQELQKSQQYGSLVLGPDTGKGAVRDGGRVVGTNALLLYHQGAQPYIKG